MLLSVDLPHEDDADDRWDQPTCHNDGSAVAEFGGDECTAEDPDDLKCTLRYAQCGSAQRVANEALASSKC